MNVVMTAGGGFVETQATAEREAYSRTQLDEMLEVAERGIRDLVRMQCDVLRAANQQVSEPASQR
jgi:ribonuclease PH